MEIRRFSRVLASIILVLEGLSPVDRYKACTVKSPFAVSLEDFLHWMDTTRKENL